MLNTSQYQYAKEYLLCKNKLLLVLSVLHYKNVPIKCIGGLSSQICS